MTGPTHEKFKRGSAPTPVTPAKALHPMTTPVKTKKIFVLAGESSGDLLGGKLLQAIRELNPQIEFIGIGGPHMQAAGLKSLFPMEELSIMGIFEVLRHLPQILKRIQYVADFIQDNQPDVIVTIDLPDFSFRLAKKVRPFGIPHIHYTAPSVWAWRPGRAKKISKLVDHLLCLLPFEPPYFTVHGLKATFVGHMVTELAIPSIPTDAFYKRHNLYSHQTLICMLPGSRHGEAKRMLPVFIETLKKIALLHPDAVIAVPTVKATDALVKQSLQNTGLNIIYITDQQERYEAMRACHAALAASGTVSLELSMAQTPTVIAYKVNAITAWIARKIVYARYMTLTNILLDREAIPEFFQEKCTAENLFKALNNLLIQKETVQRMNANQKEAMKMLAPGDKSPSAIAAETVLSYINP